MNSLSQKKKNSLLYDSLKIREEIIDIAASPTGCHIGGSLSSVELLNCSFEFYGRDKNTQIILSKGHAAAALYATLFIKKILNEKSSKKYGCKDSLLLGHPNDKICGIPYATGSLGPWHRICSRMGPWTILEQ